MYSAASFKRPSEETITELDINVKDERVFQPLLFITGHKTTENWTLEIPVDRFV